PAEIFIQKFLILTMRNTSVKLWFVLSLLLLGTSVKASYILIPMDKNQSNHLKAYGIAYWILENDIEVDWLLNYSGGSFMVKHYQKIENELVIRGVSYKVISDAESNQIVQQIASPASN